jgi:hypothetical protein
VYAPVYVEDPNEARRPLADFSSILLDEADGSRQVCDIERWGVAAELRHNGATILRLERFQIRGVPRN